jgi:hypothetical protein
VIIGKWGAAGAAFLALLSLCAALIIPSNTIQKKMGGTIVHKTNHYITKRSHREYNTTRAYPVDAQEH